MNIECIEIGIIASGQVIINKLINTIAKIIP